MAVFVKIKHPDLPGQTPLVTDKAYAAVWKAKGWKLDKPSRKKNPATQENEA